LNTFYNYKEEVSMTNKVRLLSYSVGVEGTEYAGKSIDEIIVGIARISSSRDVNDRFNEPYKLIRHCVTNGHWSIFDQANLCFEIHTSRAMGRELLRHWSIHPQEFSQRYASVTGFENVELRKQSLSNRQSSTEVLTGNESAIFKVGVEEVVKDAKEAYEYLVLEGVSRETARMILPECTSTTLNMNGTVRSWVTFLNQRLHKTAQKEIRIIAEEIRDIFMEKCPLISEALYNFDNAYSVPILDWVILNKYKKQLNELFPDNY
jgi:thymidylate synthase (FAD)